MSGEGLKQFHSEGRGITKSIFTMRNMTSNRPALGQKVPSFKSILVSSRTTTIQIDLKVMCYLINEQRRKRGNRWILQPMITL